MIWGVFTPGNSTQSPGSLKLPSSFSSSCSTNQLWEWGSIIQEEVTWKDTEEIEETARGQVGRAVKNGQWTFHKDGTEGEKGSPCPSQSWSQSKGFDDKENSAERCPQPQKKICMSPTFWSPKTLQLWGSSDILGRAPPRETSMTTMPSPSSL